MNPDFAIILNFKLKNAQEIDMDFLVKTARNIGVRAIAADRLENELQIPCAKYSINLVTIATGEDLATTNIIETLVQNRKVGKASIINIAVNSDGSFSAATKEMLEQINSWMHIFGHAFNESTPCNLTVDGNSFILQNRHMPYQNYIYVQKSFPQKIKVNGLTQEPNRIEMIENRTPLTFSYQNGSLIINLETATSSNFPWQIIRVQQHRPEDDIKETKF
ncbi:MULTISPECIES: hypothetical protein [unclassified Lactobacillus]|uniref:hypothetical protein n=1 Tax=unclassified Lactobacillus TaxID=2620435 RepID=UPI000EFC0544|nr:MULTISPECIES: hypothetical protein [unclassified Lactobacillus]RMC41876.1 hypothetical protein F5ESL0237_00865 [Lactobacillus sp. ESL0237]RMC45266.1 hypothetical protein F5ESL0234_00865 [Lactobacillus sp. ESL0234]RMC46867.1 hypothetical protein F5ESL0236_00870 [Lactobacillus sp. ESL0236]RMC51827.1 hypothetical protein F5ESL0225_00865 [Lactobacillus sp. ESL0225]